jgi:hypothetical protein
MLCFLGKPDCFIVSFPQTILFNKLEIFILKQNLNLFPKIFVLFVLFCNFTRKFASVYCFPCSIVLIYDFVLSNYVFIFLDGVSTPAQIPPSIEPTLFSPDFTPGIEKVSIEPTLIFFTPGTEKSSWTWGGVGTIVLVVLCFGCCLCCFLGLITKFSWCPCKTK